MRKLDARSISMYVVVAIYDGVAIDQRNFIIAWVRDDIAVGRATRRPEIALDVVHRS